MSKNAFTTKLQFKWRDWSFLIDHNVQDSVFRGTATIFNDSNGTWLSTGSIEDGSLADLIKALKNAIRNFEHRCKAIEAAREIAASIGDE